MEIYIVVNLVKGIWFQPCRVNEEVLSDAPMRIFKVGRNACSYL